MIFPMPTNVESSPVQWSIGYSMNEVLYPQIQPERLQTLATYQTGSCNQNKPISRFYNTAKTYRRFGIQYQTTDGEIANFNAPGTLYGGSLPVNQGSSVNLKVFRQTAPNSANVVGRLLLTYYITYKGNKGDSSLVAP